MDKRKKYNFIDKEFLQKEYVDANLTDTELARKLKCNVYTIKAKRKQFNISAIIKLQGKNLIGQKFGKLTVLKESHRAKKRIHWICRCDCGNEIVVKGHDMILNLVDVCIGSQRKNTITGKVIKKLPDTNGVILSKVPKKRKILFNLTKEEAWFLLEKQNFKCFLSEEPISVGKDASIDRINSLEGYTLNNICWVHKDINVMKWEYSIDRFLQLCNLVVNNSDEEGCIEIVKKKSKKWSGSGNISGDCWYGIKYNAKIRSIPFEVDINYAWDLFVQQKGKCAISGIPIAFAIPGESRHTRTASLDRKNSSVQYIKNNIWWVHKDINNIKWKLDFGYFFDLCNKVVQKQQKVICG